MVCYTHANLEKLALSFPDRGVLATTIKIGLKKEDKSVHASMINPIYLFYAYFVKGLEKQENAFIKISENTSAAMKKLGSDF